MPRISTRNPFWVRPACPARPSRRNCARRHASRPSPWTPIRWERFSIMRKIRLRRSGARAGPAAGIDRRRSTCFGRSGPSARPPAAIGGGRHSPRRAEFWAPRERAAEAATALREEVHGLVDHLQTALGIEGEEPRPWREALLALAHQTPRGLWTVEARLLYDLQKGMRRSGANDFDDRRHAVDLVAGAAADPPRAAQPAPGARVTAPSQRRAAAAFRADFGTAAAATGGSLGRGDRDGRGPPPRRLSPQDRRHAR